MLDARSNLSKWRALLTDTLPYEVPVIFSNDKLFASLVSESVEPKIKEVLERCRGTGYRYTIPYSYQIAKNALKTTSLGIIHPNHQLAICNFYNLYKQSLLDQCNRSEMTLRRPISETPLFSKAVLQEGKTPKLGIPHIDPEDGKMDVGHLVSVFSYGKYNLLGKFVDSFEYRRLEKRFKYLRTIDVTRCFFNIYTHSVTWAVKDKAFAKSHTQTYSFESQFDALMQRSNYNETNGIVVGPEISRIFAEIILQDVDRLVETRLQSHNLEHNRHFAIRRYVDDFFIFSNSMEELDSITAELEKSLETYKLFVNHKKTETRIRPFVSNISLARDDLSELIDGIHKSLDSAEKAKEATEVSNAAREIVGKSLRVRLICERYKVDFNSLSGWLMSILRVLLDRSLKLLKSAKDEETEGAASDVAASILQIAFYVCALDTRVRTTYSLCQIIARLKAENSKSPTEEFDRLWQFVSEELEDLIRSEFLSATHRNRENIELFNLLIAGAFYLDPEFVRSGYSRRVLEDLSSQKNLGYFAYATTRFCMQRDEKAISTEIQSMDETIKNNLVGSKATVYEDAETYLLACDFLSNTNIAHKHRRIVQKELFGGTLTNNQLDTLAQHIGFIDWDGLRITHLVERKSLKPVYAWA